MQLSNIPRISSRPQIKRMSQKELQGTKYGNDFDSPSTASTNRWANRSQSQVVPDLNNSWAPSVEQAKIPDDNDKPCFQQKWFWVFGGVFCLLLILAVVAIVLGIVLPMTTTTAPGATASPKMLMINLTTSATITCLSSGRGVIAYLNGSTSSGWTSYSYNYTAAKTEPTIMFGFETDGLQMYYLDNVSVVDNSAPSNELLSNPNFENSTTSAVDWFTSCESTCGGVASQIVSGTQCSGSSGNCFMARCTSGGPSISFLSQAFVATIGNTYTISYILNQAGVSNNGTMSFYFDIS